MKKIVFFIIWMFLLQNVNAQKEHARIISEQELPVNKRGDYSMQAREFLTQFYGVLRYGISNIISNESLGKDYLMDKGDYKPEFTLVLNKNADGLDTPSYLQELTKELFELDKNSNLQFRVSDIQVEPEFYQPDITCLYVVLNYTLELLTDETTQFKRRCQAYCMFPEASNPINVRLLRIQPLHDLVSYKQTKQKMVIKVAGDDHDWMKSYDYVSSPGFDRRRVIRSNDRWGVVTEEGDIIVPFKYDRIGSLYRDETTCIWEYQYPYLVWQDGKAGFIDTSGKELVKPLYDDVYYMYLFDYSGVQIGNKYGALNTEGKLVIPAKYDSWVIFPVDEDWAHTTLGKRHGFVHRNGKYFIDFKYEQAEDFSGGMAAVVLDGKVGFIDNNGELVISNRYKSAWNRKGKKEEYEHLYKFNSEGTAIVMFDKKHFALIDKKGHRITTRQYRSIVPADGTASYYKAVYDNSIKGRDEISLTYLDPYGNQYDTAEKCKEGKEKIRQARLTKEFQAALDNYNAKRYNLSFPEFQRLANDGHAQSMRYLALSYEYGRGTAKNQDEMLRWLSNAAAKGDDSSQNEMGYHLYHGKIIDQDLNKAAQFFLKAANAGNMYGMHNYANCLENGWGLPKNIKVAIDWYNKAIAKGYVPSMVMLGKIYYYGDKQQPKDYQKAVDLFTKAADAGDMEAVMHIGKCYYYGEGKPRNYNEASIWFEKSAGEQPESCYYLGWMNEFAQGRKQNIRAAIQWYGKCPGFKDSDKRVKDLKKKYRIK